MASQPSPSTDEVFEAWVESLPEARRDRLSDHITIARNGALWMREWLPTLKPTDRIMSAADFATWDPMDSDDGVVLTAVELERWAQAGLLPWEEDSVDAATKAEMEQPCKTGKGPCPWPPAPRS